MSRRACTLAVVLLACPGARAAEQGEPVWQPGNPTTSRVQPSVTGDAPVEDDDGVHGRFEGDLDLGIHGGVQVADTVGGAFGATAHYFSMAGIYGRYADAFAAEGAAPLRLLSGGIDVRPVFVPRWSQDMTTRAAVTDLMLDSISLELGGYLASLEDSLGDEHGFEASLGLGIPLMGDAEGLWLDGRGLLRWPDPDSPRSGPDAVALVTLGWHWLVMLRRE